MTLKYTAQSIRTGEMERRELSLQVFGQGTQMERDKDGLHLINDICGNQGFL